MALTAFSEKFTLTPPSDPILFAAYEQVFVFFFFPICVVFTVLCPFVFIVFSPVHFHVLPSLHIHPAPVHSYLQAYRSYLFFFFVTTPSHYQLLSFPCLSLVNPSLLLLSPSPPQPSPYLTLSDYSTMRCSALPCTAFCSLMLVLFSLVSYFFFSVPYLLFSLQFPSPFFNHPVYSPLHSLTFR